jgi:hypothetical protein
MIYDDKKYHIIAFRYPTRYPHWIAKEENSHVLVEIPITGYLNYRMVGPKLCVGSKVIGSSERKLCPKHKVIEGRESQCEDCRKSEGFLGSFFIGDGCSQGEKWKKYSQNDLFVVYLAAFNQHIFKVGMSNQTRVMERLREQGAWAGSILYEGGGTQARQVERQIASLGFKESFTAKQKTDYVYPSSVSSEIMEKLAMEKSRILNLLHFSSPVDNFHSELTLLNEYYKQGSDISSLPHYVKVSDSSLIKGQVRFVKGNVVVLDNEISLYCFDAWRPTGWMLKRNSVADESKDVEPQLSLFG